MAELMPEIAPSEGTEMVVSKGRVYDKEKGVWHEVEHAPDEKTRKKMEKQREKETQNALRREKLNDMQYLQNKILPPDTKLQPLLNGERKYVEKDTKVSEYGASAVGNRVIDGHMLTVMERGKAMVRELRALEAQYKFLRHKTDERSVKELEKTARRKEIVKAKLDKSVQTLRFRESVEPVTVEEGKIGVVLFASFGSVGGDLEDVTTVVEQAVVRGGIDRFMVTCGSLGIDSRVIGHSTDRVLSIIYLGKTPPQQATKVKLGFAWTPRFERPPDQVYANESSPSGGEGVAAGRGGHDDHDHDDDDVSVASRGYSGGYEEQGHGGDWWQEGLLSALCAISPERQPQRRVVLMEPRAEEDGYGSEDGGYEDSLESYEVAAQRVAATRSPERSQGKGGGSSKGGDAWSSLLPSWCQLSPPPLPLLSTGGSDAKGNPDKSPRTPRTPRTPRSSARKLDTVRVTF